MIGVWPVLILLFACDPTYRRILAEPHTCPEGTEERVSSRGFGGGGYTRFCSRRWEVPGGHHELREGPSQSWSHGRKVIEGAWLANQKHGRWMYWREADGTLMHVADWDAGELKGERVYAADGITVVSEAGQVP